MIDTEQAWAAVTARDATYDGRFVFAVATTRIYCRPSCPSRRPHRRNVQFLATPAAAAAAGYRACKRCKPEMGKESPVTQRIQRARAFLDAHDEESVSLARLGREIGLSPYHLQRTFKRVVGLSPKAYVAARLAERLRERLKAEPTVSRAIYAAGYNSSSSAYAKAGDRLGMTPSAYRRGGRGLRIRYAVVPSSLGRVLIAATERGICAVSFGSRDTELEAGLRREYPNAEIARSDELGPWVKAVLAQVEGNGDRGSARNGGGGGVPLDVQGTPFQWRVWQALQAVPAGETRSYAQLAAQVGQPTAARAVAQACATNRVAVVVPCHRAVRGNGELGGYRWGVERKRRLLERERRAAS